MRQEAVYEGFRTFYNFSRKPLSFHDVIRHVLKFMNKAPEYQYRLSIGSDSQTYSNKSLLVTVIHLHRIGRGAIGFITYQRISRSFNSLREKIYRETTATLEIACMFTPEVMGDLLSPFYNRKRGDINFEFHLDIGKRGATRDLINEMVAIAKSTPFEPRIKPESYAASSYANRHTKKRVNK